MASTIRFLRQYLRPRPEAVRAEAAEYVRDRRRLPADVYRPARRSGRLPAWVLLHGLTWSGREHPSLVPFARAVAASGAVVCVPDIPEWRDLRVAPAVTGPSIAAAADVLAARGDVDAERIGVIGFSFGATQALVAAAEPALAARISGIAAWGGYADVHSLFHFGITGEYELDGRHYHADPDPYGGWVMGSNYLPAVPGVDSAAPLADALRQLAVAAGKAGIYAADASFDPLKLRLREEIPPEGRPLLDLFAPRAGDRVNRDRAGEIARELADAAIRVDPMFDPTPALPHVTTRTFLAHGRDDRLVPFTESYRLHRRLPPGISRGVTVTSLFAHSGGTLEDLGPLGILREGARFVRLLNGILDLV